MNYYYSPTGAESHAWTWIPLLGGSILLLIVWSLFWKGLALWHSAQRRQPWWFFFLLVLNTAGILEIIYLFAVAKMKFSRLFKK